VGGVLVTLRDVTAELEGRAAEAERVPLAAALAESEERFRVMADAVPQIVWRTDAAGRTEFFNRQWTAYTGAPYEPSTAAQVAADFVHPSDWARTMAAFAEARRTGGVFAVEHRLRSAAGEYRWFLVRAGPYRDPATGDVVRWFGASVDIDDRKRAEAERERLLGESERARAEADAARREAEAASRAKSEFLATMSHELRTPLNAIGGYAELLALGLRGPVTEQQRVDLARIQQSQRHLLGLVNEVLDLAKVDAGELRVERDAVRAGDTVDAALALVRPQATAKGLTLIEYAGPADRPYLGDEPRVRQVLVNLLANAVKFTGPGGLVAVTCALTNAPAAGAALAPDTPYVAVRVADTGVGIAPDQLERIFAPFTQAEGGLTRARGGTGLGLAISRRLARLMGGDLTVESQVGVGSAFTLWLPTPERRAHPRPHGPGTAADRVTPPERPTPPAPSAVPAVEAPALARVGEALVAELGPVLRAWVARLRADPGIPDVAARTETELEDHAATFVTDVALALRTMGQPGGEPAALHRDGMAIMALIAERHGTQRARLGWPEAAITREFALLAEVLDGAVRRLAGARAPTDAVAAERAAVVVAQLLDQAARLSLGGYRLATEDGGA
jgi:PAS domain S-box-containing protein